MSKRDPWMKFFPTDWRSDPRLRMCSPAARGLWIDMICLMHEADPYGHLVVGGVAPTDTQLSMLTATPAEQLPDLIAELETAGVFTRNRRGVIYSRRMTRDDRKKRTARENGRKGGNPSLRKQREIPPSDNPKDKPQKPYSKCQKEDTTSVASSSPAAAPNPDRRNEPSFLEAVRDAANAPENTAWSTDPFLSPVVNRWLALGLTEQEILTVVRATSRGRHISSPSYFNGPMQDAAGRKSAPALVPTAGMSRASPSFGATAGLDRIRQRYGVG